MTREDVTHAYSRLCSALGREADDCQLIIWQDLLGGLPGDLLLSAVDDHLLASRWLATPSELFDRVAIKRAGTSRSEPERHWAPKEVVCLACSDTGWRTIWTADAMAAALAFARGDTDKRTFRGRLSAGVAFCDCERGKREADIKRPAGASDDWKAVFFDTSKMVEIDCRKSDSDQIESLLSWARAIGGKRGNGK